MDVFYADYLQTLYQSQFQRKRLSFMVQSNLKNLMIYQSSTQLIMGFIDIFQEQNHQIDLVTFIIKKQDYSIMRLRNRIKLISRKENIANKQIDKIQISLQKNPIKEALYLIKLAYTTKTKRVYNYINEWLMIQNKDIKLTNILQNEFQKGKLQWINDRQFYLSNQNSIKGFYLVKDSSKVLHQCGLSGSITTAKCCDYSYFSIWDDTTLLCFLDKSGQIYCLLSLKNQKPSYKQELLLNKHKKQQLKPGLHLLSLILRPNNLQGQYKKIKIYQHIYKQCQYTIFSILKHINRQNHHQIVLQFYFLSITILNFHLIEIVKIVQETKLPNQYNIQFLFKKLINHKIYYRYNESIKSINFQPFFQYFINLSSNYQFPTSIQHIQQDQPEQDEKYKQIIEYNNKIFIIKQILDQQSEIYFHIITNQINNDNLVDQKIKFISKIFVQNPLKEVIFKYQQNNIISYPLLKTNNQNIKTYFPQVHYKIIEQGIRKKNQQLGQYEQQLNQNGQQQFQILFAQKILQYEQLKKQVARNHEQIEKLYLQIQQTKQSTIYQEHMLNRFQDQYNKLQLIQSFSNQSSSSQLQAIMFKIKELMDQSDQIKTLLNEIAKKQSQIY